MKSDVGRLRASTTAHGYGFAVNAEVTSTTKREEYAQAGIPEYWIVDPELDQITVLTLDGQSVHGEFKRGERATSKRLPGFGVDVTSALTPKR